MRIWHHIDKWESVGAGLYSESAPAGMNAIQAKQAYADFLGNSARFKRALERVLREWPIACEQFLSNGSINRIAWLGQAAMCIDSGIPCKFRSGFALLTCEQQRNANGLASEILDKWEGAYRAPVQLLPHDQPRPVRGIHAKIWWYLNHWTIRGYRNGIPEEVPQEVSRKQYAPSWKSIAVAILSNDVALQSIGFSGPYSEFYTTLKRLEFNGRGKR